MAISRTRLRTLNRWMVENNRKEISAVYVEVDKEGCSSRGTGSIDGMLTALINVITDIAVQSGITSEEITGKIIGLIAEKKRRGNKWI